MADDQDEPDMIFGEVAERPVGLDAYGFPDRDAPPADSESDTFFGKAVGNPLLGAGDALTYDEVFDAVTPPGTDKAALLAALKAAQVTGGQLPGNRAPDISGPASAVPDVFKRAFPALGGIIPEPEDPFTDADASDIALGAMFDGMIRGGIPKDSVERIIGHMLADMGPREPGPERG